MGYSLEVFHGDSDAAWWWGTCGIVSFRLAALGHRDGVKLRGTNGIGLGGTGTQTIDVSTHM